MLAVVAVAALGACGADSTPARTTPGPIASSTAPAMAAPATEVDTAVEEPAPIDDRPEPTETAAGDPVRTDSSSSDGQAPTLVGDWQRHASVLHLDPDPASSTFTTGTSCCDVETWTATWTPIGANGDDGVVVTLVQRTFLSGDGLGGSLYEGGTFEASPSIGYNGTRVLMTYGLGDAPGVLTWCRSGQGVPECGA